MNGTKNGCVLNIGWHAGIRYVAGDLFVLLDCVSMKCLDLLWHVFAALIVIS